MSKYSFTPEMDEISGMGGAYEARCRDMLRDGLVWLDNHPDADPHISTLTKGDVEVYGVIREDNADAEALSKVMQGLSDGPGCSGAMLQAVMQAALWVHAYGWDEYVKRMAKQ